MSCGQDYRRRRVVRTLERTNGVGMLVFESHSGGESVAIWVEGSPTACYTITRRMGTGASEIETIWKLSRMQSLQLRTKLGSRVHGDNLFPTAGATHTFDMTLADALATLVPPAQPHTWRGND